MPFPVINRYQADFSVEKRILYLNNYKVKVTFKKALESSAPVLKNYALESGLGYIHTTPWHHKKPSGIE